MQVDLEPELHINSNLDAEGSETIPLSEEIVNPGRMKLGPQDFELKKVLGKGGYGKVFQVSFVEVVCCMGGLTVERFVTRSVQLLCSHYTVVQLLLRSLSHSRTRSQRVGLGMNGMSLTLTENRNKLHKQRVAPCWRHGVKMHSSKCGCTISHYVWCEMQFFHFVKCTIKLVVMGVTKHKILKQFPFKMGIGGGVAYRTEANRG